MYLVDAIQLFIYSKYSKYQVCYFSSLLGSPSRVSWSNGLHFRRKKLSIVNKLFFVYMPFWLSRTNENLGLEIEFHNAFFVHLTCCHFIVDRMPVIFSNKESIEMWLNAPPSTNFDTILKPYEEKDLVIVLRQMSYYYCYVNAECI